MSVKRVASKQQCQSDESLQRKKQVGHFLMPDSPTKKKLRRKTSPERVPCPMVPGTPETPPPRVRRSWEVALSPSPPPRQQSPPWRATSTVLSEPRTPPPLQEHCIMSPSTSVVTIQQTATSTVEPVFEYVDLPLPNQSHPVTGTAVRCSGTSANTVPGPSSSENSSQEILGEYLPVPSVFDDIDRDIQECERTLADPGSDIENSDVEIDDTEVFNITCGRTAYEFPSTAEEMRPELLEMLVDLDQEDDRHLHQLASEDMMDFRWDSNPQVFTGQREDFTGEAGPTFEIKDMTPFEIFKQIWDESIISLIVRETNKYAKQLLRNPNIFRFARLKRWQDITPEELWTFFGMIMLQSIMSISVEKEYWRPCLPYLKLGNFAEFMSYHRFALIKKCLHFVDNTLLPTTSGPSRLAKVMPVIDHLNQKFSSLYMPDVNITIDESLLMWKGQLSWAQLIRNKAARVGIKTYELCESKSGYLWQMLVYSGKRTLQAEEGHELLEVTESSQTATSKIVYDLVRPLLNRGHTLVMDNFYNSPLLSRTLKLKKTDTMGTLRLSRQFVPSLLREKTKQTMRTGDVAFSQTKDMTILVWKDANVVALISTYHKVEVGGKEKHGLFKYKPQVVLDYNLAMGGVDKKDQILQAFPVERIRNQIWYKKLFRRLLNVSIHNAFVMFNARGQRMTSRQFRVRLADEIMQKFRTPKIMPELSSGHFPIKTTSKMPRCKLCYQNKVLRRTTWKCDTCDVSLCLPECFKIYHTANVLN